MSVASYSADAGLRNPSAIAILRETPGSADSARSEEQGQGTNVGAPTLKVLLEVSEPASESKRTAINAHPRSGKVPEVMA